MWWTQFIALIVKRFHYTKRKLFALLIQNVLPAVIITITLLVARGLQTIPDPPPLELSPGQWFSVNRDNYLFIGGYYTEETSKYVDTFFQPCGIGGHQTSDDFSGCFQGNGDYISGYSYPCAGNPSHKYICTCHNGTDVLCNDPGFFPIQAPICFNGTGTGSRVQNLTRKFDSNDPISADQDLATYLLRSQQTFIQRRYGGVSFGYDIDISIEDKGLFLAANNMAKVWYSLKGYHAVPTYINVANNALMKAHLEKDKQSQYGEAI